MTNLASKHFDQHFNQTPTLDFSNKYDQQVDQNNRTNTNIMPSNKSGWANCSFKNMKLCHVMQGMLLLRQNESCQENTITELEIYENKLRETHHKGVL